MSWVDEHARIQATQQCIEAMFCNGHGRVNLGKQSTHIQRVHIPMSYQATMCTRTNEKERTTVKQKEDFAQLVDYYKTHGIIPHESSNGTMGDIKNIENLDDTVFDLHAYDIPHSDSFPDMLEKEEYTD